MDDEQRELALQAYVQHGRMVLRHARRILGDEQEARDVLQDIFVALLDRPLRFEGRSALGTYLCSAATHLCLNRLRNQRNRIRLAEGRSATFAPPPDRMLPDAVVVLQQVLARLSLEEARAAVYHYVDGMSHAEIAAELCCSRRRIGDLLDRVRARLSHQYRREVAR